MKNDIKKKKKWDRCTITYRTTMIVIGILGLIGVGAIYINVSPVKVDIPPIEPPIIPENLTKSWHKAFEGTVTDVNRFFGPFYLTGEKAIITWIDPEKSWSDYESEKVTLTYINETDTGHEISPGFDYEVSLGTNEGIPRDSWYCLHRDTGNYIYIVVYLYY